VPTCRVGHDILVQEAFDQRQHAASLIDPSTSAIRRSCGMESKYPSGQHPPQRCCLPSAADQPPAEHPCSLARTKAVLPHGTELKDRLDDHLQSRWTMRSFTVGIPRGRVLPSPLGISTRLTGLGRRSPPSAQREVPGDTVPIGRRTAQRSGHPPQPPPCPRNALPRSFQSARANDLSIRLNHLPPSGPAPGRPKGML